MISIDIAKSNDPFYRYKMPKILIKYENGKTVITNIKEIGNSLKRNHIPILSYFGYSLGSQTSEEKGKCTLNGEFIVTELTEVLYNYIGEYVLCEKCSNPETIFHIEKNNLISICSSCGHKKKFEDTKTVKIIKKTLN